MLNLGPMAGKPIKLPPNLPQNRGPNGRDRAASQLHARQPRVISFSVNLGTSMNLVGLDSLTSETAPGTKLNRFRCGSHGHASKAAKTAFKSVTIKHWAQNPKGPKAHQQRLARTAVSSTPTNAQPTKPAAKAKSFLLLMIEILHDFKDPKLWESWYIP